MAAKKTRSKTTPKKQAARAKPARRKTARKRRTADPETGVDGRVAQIQRLIDVMVAAGAVEVELREDNTRLRVRLKEDVPAVVSYPPPQAHTLQAAAPAGPGATEPAGAPPAAAESDEGRVLFHSPMVGTFYASPSPEAEPFVQLGDRVDPDTTLCILEAMKVMNEIKAEISGSIVQVLAQNGQPVEFGQPLFVIQVD